MDYRLQKVVALLRTVITNFFETGEMPGEYAFAKVFQAYTIANSLLGEADEENLLEAFLEHPTHSSIIYSEDESLLNQISNLEEQLEMLQNSTAPRNELMFFGNEPDLRLLPPLNNIS